MIDLKNVRLPEDIFFPFWCHFHVLIRKMWALAVSHLTVTLRMISTVTIKDHSLLSVLYMCDSFFNRYVTPWMKNSNFLELSAIGTVTSACLIFGHGSTDLRLYTSTKLKMVKYRFYSLKHKKQNLYLNNI